MPAHLEVSGLIRAVEAAGGFATVLHKGEREAGTIVVLTTERGGNARVFERMPSPEGGRSWVLSRSQDIENPMEIGEYLDRRKAQDRDLWIVELDIANGERFIGLN
ncbi:MAG: DUF1491 family protein [Novosphingobium sp.]